MQKSHYRFPREFSVVCARDVTFEAFFFVQAASETRHDHHEGRQGRRNRGVGNFRNHWSRESNSMARHAEIVGQYLRD